jgi:hypothetical protein
VLPVRIDERLPHKRGVERLEVKVGEAAVKRAVQITLVVERDSDVKVVHVRLDVQVSVVDPAVLQEVQQERVGRRAGFVPLVQNQKRRLLLAGKHGLWKHPQFFPDAGLLLFVG